MHTEAAPISTISGQGPASSQDPIWTEPEPTSDEDLAEHLPPEYNGPTPGQYQTNNRQQLADVPQLEEVDWEECQFTNADLTTCNNSTHESGRLRKEYSSQFQQHTDNQYYSPTNNTSGLDYYLPEPNHYNLDTRPQQHKQYHNPNVFLIPPPDPRDIERWYGGKSRGRKRHLELHKHRLYGQKT